jgi:hypothetical protein
MPLKLEGLTLGTNCLMALAPRIKGALTRRRRDPNAARRVTIRRDWKNDGLGVRAVLHGLDALLDWLKSRSEHGGGQLGDALAIADSGFDPFLDQLLL